MVSPKLQSVDKVIQGVSKKSVIFIDTLYIRYLAVDMPSPSGRQSWQGRYRGHVG